MKNKLFLSAFLFMMVFGALSAAADAPRINACRFIDADGDGYCDNAGRAGRFRDADGDGYCDNAGRAGRACRFSDADGDGYCDNAGRAGRTCRFRDGNGDGCLKSHGHFSGRRYDSGKRR